MNESQLTLLLVDDDPMIIESLGPLLERSGLHVLTAADGEKALSLVQSHHPDVIVMDVLMPRMNGREALHRLRKSNVWTPTILLTQVGEAIERAPPGDPYGELYFSVSMPDYASQPDPNTPIDQFITRLVRLPGSCVVGLIECPVPENVPTPFNMQNVLATDSDSGALTWSPDGRYGVINIHPQDDFTKGWAAEEWEWFKMRKLEDLNISPSTRYLFDAENDAWRELYVADRKFFILRIGRRMDNGLPSPLPPAW